MPIGLYITPSSVGIGRTDSQWVIYYPINCWGMKNRFPVGYILPAHLLGYEEQIPSGLYITPSPVGVGRIDFQWVIYYPLTCWSRKNRFPVGYILPAHLLGYEEQIPSGLYITRSPVGVGRIDFQWVIYYPLTCWSRKNRFPVGYILPPHLLE